MSGASGAGGGPATDAAPPAPAPRRAAPDEVPFPRHEQVFLALAAVFLGAMVAMNVLGITRFIEVGGWTLPFTVFGERVTVFQLAIGVLPYPITFLVTDLVSELYGKRRATFLVWVGFGLNCLLLLVCWAGQLFPAPFDAHGQFYREAWVAMGGLGEPPRTPPPGLFYGQVWALMSGATAASMVAYLVAQLVDVQLFHFWKDLTDGRHLWLRNNGSTLVSQLVDTTCVLTITSGATCSSRGRGRWAGSRR